MRTSIPRIAVLLVALVAAPAFAAGEIELTSSVQKVVQVENEAGETVTELVDADSVVPGDELRYTVRFANVTEDTTVDAGSVVITNPIPDNTDYVAGSAFGAGTEITFSVDGGETWDTPDALTVTDADGTSRRAAPEDYTHVRWIFGPELEPGAEGVVFFRVVLR